jgi:hypothetical protein
VHQRRAFAHQDWPAKAALVADLLVELALKFSVKVSLFPTSADYVLV